MPLTYQIRAGDTVASLAARFGLSRSQLLQLNPWLRQFGTFTTTTNQAGKPTLTADLIPIQGAGIQTEKRAERSPVVEALIGGEGGDIGAALNFVLGQGVSQTDAGLLGRLLPELASAFEGINARIAAQAEQAGISPLSAPTLTPLEFIENLQRTGTLAAMLDNPTLTGTLFPHPAVTTRRVRF